MFYLLELHTGDENDNSIRDVIIEAANSDAVYNYMRNQCKTLNDAQVDGCDESVYCLYTSGESCDICTGDDFDPDCDECDCDRRMFHHDYYLRAEVETFEEAQHLLCTYHGGGDYAIKVDKDGNEVDTDSFGDTPLTPFFVEKVR